MRRADVDGGVIAGGKTINPSPFHQQFKHPAAHSPLFPSIPSIPRSPPFSSSAGWSLSLGEPAERAIISGHRGWVGRMLPPGFAEEMVAAMRRQNSWTCALRAPLTVRMMVMRGARAQSLDDSTFSVSRPLGAIGRAGRTLRWSGGVRYGRTHEFLIGQIARQTYSARQRGCRRGERPALIAPDRSATRGSRRQRQHPRS